MAASPDGQTARQQGGPAVDGLLRPAEGWLSVLAVLLMGLVVAWAVDDAHWAGWGPGGSQTAFLAPAIALAAGWGYLGAKLRWATGLVHLAGATLGAGFVILAVAGAVSDAGSVIDRLVALDRSLALFLYDVMVRQVRSDQTSMFLLAIGCTAWASGQFAAYAVFHHGRPTSAVVLLGLLLLTSMSLTLRHQFWFLVAFSGASLLLLVRSSLSQQRILAAGRCVAEAGAATGLYLRNGVAFILAALFGAVVLTSNASSAPLSGTWRQFDERFVEIGLALERFVGGISGPVRGPGGLFTASQTIRGFWEGSTAVVFTVSSTDGRGYYWRGATYDEFDGRTWKQTERRTHAVVEADRPVLDGTPEAVQPGNDRIEVTFMVTPVTWTGDTLPIPAGLYTASRQLEVVTSGDGASVTSVHLTTPVRDGDTIRLTSLVPVGGERGVTGNLLAAAGTVYPEWAKAYVAIREGSMGPLAAERADQIVAALPTSERDPYHVALAFQDYLYRSGGFSYVTDVQEICPAGKTNVVDCLLEQRQGYCEYFATTLTMMLRTQQIPARYVVGYLPGRIDAATGMYNVDRTAAHAWVEVYFPGHGWIPFDPTPGNRENGQTPTRIPDGPPVPTPTPNPDASAGPSLGPEFRDDGYEIDYLNRLPGDTGPSTGAGGFGGSDGLAQPAVWIGGGVLAAVAFVMWRRRRRSIPSPEGAWSGLTRIAGALGYGPRPAQTVYEYAGMLGDALPSARPELEVVAHARVEATYGRLRPTGEGIAALGAAWGRLRRRLLLLALPWRRRKRG